MVASFAARHWPFANGSGRIIDQFCARKFLGHGEVTARTADGVDLQVFADDLIGRHIIISGRFDQSIVDVLLSHARPGDTLLDVGANIGYVSAVFLKRVASSRVICFEPQPGIVDLLRKNMEQFAGRARIFAAGLADRNGSLRFTVDEANRGGSRFDPNGSIEAPVLEARGAFQQIETVDLMKIDVEGFENVIFANAEPELARLRPRAILLEDQTGSVAPNGEIGVILARLGYRVHGIDKRLFATRLSEIESRDDCRFNDYLATLAD
jgi:FkbM family methyltransferase